MTEGQGTGNVVVNNMMVPWFLGGAWVPKWRSKEPVEGLEDDMLRSQLVLGLQPGPIQVELQRRVRREPGLSFQESCREARAMENKTESQLPREVETRRTYSSPQVPTPAARQDVDSWNEMKEALRAELTAEIRSQMAEVKTALLTELRTQRGSSATHGEPEARMMGRPGRRAGRPSPRERTPQWDDQGRPICLQCGQAGHMQRVCPRRESNRAEFSVSSAAAGVTSTEGRDAPARFALVGECPEVEVLVQGKLIPCILDTGSQVTLFSQSLFQRYLRGEGMKSAGEVSWLTLKPMD
ncbi:uncharacterized protein ACO6RY_14356 [Pungitius sinensis]